MSLNDLVLSASTLANLYPNTLVIPDGTRRTTSDPTPPLPAQPAPFRETSSETPPQWKFLGNNGKNIVVVVRSSEAVHLPDDELSFLANMLTACKLSLADVAIVNFERHNMYTYSDFINRFQARQVLLFGIEPVEFNLPVNFPHFQVQALAHCTFLSTPPLGVMKEDALLKSKLWICLKSIFNI